MSNKKNYYNKKQQKIKEVQEFLSKEPRKLSKRVSIIFDGKQYNIRIPIDFAQKAQIDTNHEEFEFTLEVSDKKDELPALYGDLVEKK